MPRKNAPDLRLVVRHEDVHLFAFQQSRTCNIARLGIGFVLGGIAISPFTPGPHLSDLHTFEVFAEVGVVLLMFSIGVEFSIPELMRVRSVALIGGPIGVLIIVLLAVVVGPLFGWSTTEGFIIGAAVSVASISVLTLGKANPEMTADERELLHYLCSRILRTAGSSSVKRERLRQRCSA